MTLFKVDEAFTTIFPEYSHFAHLFSPELIAELSNYTGIKNHTIDLVHSKQPVYKLIYSLEPMKLEILQTYIKKNLVKSFVKLSKSSIGALISFIKKLDDSLCLCINYQGLTNLTIKNQYQLPLIGNFPDWLDWVKQFL